jgi:hypothetical protein
LDHGKINSTNGKVEIVFDLPHFSHAWETMETDNPSEIDRISLISKDSDGDEQWYDVDQIF